MAKPISFLAAFPSIQSAIKVTGDKSGMRIMLDIPESEMAEALKLMLYRQVVLKVTIEVDEQKKSKSNSNPNGSTAGSRTLKRSTARK